LSEFYYKWIFDQQVDPKKVKEAERVLKYCQKTLNMPRLIIRWCKKIDKETYDKCDKGLYREVIKTLKGLDKHKEEFLGMVKVVSQKNIIWIRADIPLNQIGHVVVHECKHIADFINGYWIKNEKDEKKTDEFARKAMGEIRRNSDAEVSE